MNMGKHIRAIRKKLELSQYKFWERYGVDRIRASRYERGITKIPLELLVQIAKDYNLSVDNLIGLPPRTVEVSREGTATKVPIVGKVQAGEVTEIYHVPLGEMWLDSSRIPHEELEDGTPRFVALKVTGESMEHFGILDDDIIICDRAVERHPPQKGDIVVAHHRRYGYTLKRFAGIQKVSGVSVLVLQPGSPRYHPLTLPAEKVSIYGVVVLLTREYKVIGRGAK